jgi:hypothetical protein
MNTNLQIVVIMCAVEVSIQNAMYPLTLTLAPAHHPVSRLRPVDGPTVAAGASSQRGHEIMSIVRECQCNFVVYGSAICLLVCPPDLILALALDF